MHHFAMHRGQDAVVVTTKSSRATTATIPPPTNPNQLEAYFTGLGADPNNSDEPLFSESCQFLALYPGGDILGWAWDQFGSWNTQDAINECEAFLKIYRAGNSRGAYTKLLMRGHSFGGAFLIFLVNWLAANAPDAIVDFAVFYDAVPNPICRGPWRLPMGTVTDAMQFTQHNGLNFPLFILGPNGTAMPPDTRFVVSRDFQLGTAGMSHNQIVQCVWQGVVLPAMQGAMK